METGLGQAATEAMLALREELVANYEEAKAEHGERAKPTAKAMAALQAADGAIAAWQQQLPSLLAPGA